MWDPRLLGPGSEGHGEYERYLQEASKHKVRYEFELEGLLRRLVFAFAGVHFASYLNYDSRYNISEAECVAGLLLRSPKTRVRVEKDHDIRVRTGLSVH